MPDTLFACNVLHAALHPEIGGVDVVSQHRQTQVHNYLTPGNTKASNVIAGGGVQGYLYLLHEAIELDEIAKRWTPPVTAPVKAGFVKRGGAHVVNAAAGANTPKPPHGVVSEADAIARSFELRAERTFARLFLAEMPSLDSLVASTTALPTIDPTEEEIKAAQVNDPMVRSKVAAVLGCETTADARDVAGAASIRKRLYAMNLTELRGLGPVGRLAYTLWEVRGRRGLDDWFDWFIAERTLAAL